MNSVNIIGRLREKIDDHYRYFEYELPFDQTNSEQETRIVIKNWTRLPNSRLLVLEDNLRVAMHAHLDADKKFGTILVVEELQVLR